MRTAGPSGEPSQRSDHAIAVAITGKKASPFSVSRYWAQLGRGAPLDLLKDAAGAHSELSRSSQQAERHREQRLEVGEPPHAKERRPDQGR